MKVRATSPGFINGSLVSPGDELDVTEKQFSKKWMESLEPEPAPKVEKPAKAAKPAPAPAHEEI
jgi:hypothetical protein